MWDHKMPQITLASDQGGNSLQKQDVQFLFAFWGFRELAYNGIEKFRVVMDMFLIS